MARGKPKPAERPKSLFLAMQDAKAGNQSGALSQPGSANSRVHPPPQPHASSGPQLSQEFTKKLANLNIARNASTSQSAQRSANGPPLQRLANGQLSPAQQGQSGPGSKRGIPSAPISQHQPQSNASSRQKTSRMAIQDPRGYQMMKQTSHLAKEEDQPTREQSATNGLSESDATPAPTSTVSSGPTPSSSKAPRAPFVTKMLSSAGGAAQSSDPSKPQVGTRKSARDPTTQLFSKQMPSDLSAVFRNTRRRNPTRAIGQRPDKLFITVRSTVRNEHGIRPDVQLDVRTTRQIPKEQNPFEVHFQRVMQLAKRRSQSMVREDEFYHQQKVSRLQIVADAWAKSRADFIKEFGQPRIALDVELVLCRLTAEVYNLQRDIQKSKGKYSPFHREDAVKKIMERSAWLGFVFQGQLPAALLGTLVPSQRKKRPLNQTEEIEDVLLIDLD